MPDLLTFSSDRPGWRAGEGRDEATHGSWLSPAGTTVRAPGPLRAVAPAAARRRGRTSPTPSSVMNRMTITADSGGWSSCRRAQADCSGGCGGRSTRSRSVAARWSCPIGQRSSSWPARVIVLRGPWRPLRSPATGRAAWALGLLAFAMAPRPAICSRVGHACLLRAALLPALS